MAARPESRLENRSPYRRTWNVKTGRGRERRSMVGRVVLILSREVSFFIFVHFPRAWNRFCVYCTIVLRAA